MGLLSILGGPRVGASLAWLNNALGGVHPGDVGYTYTFFSVIGGIAGLLAGVAFAITGLFCPRGSHEKAPTTRSVDILDVLYWMPHIFIHCQNDGHPPCTR